MKKLFNPHKWSGRFAALSDGSAWLLILPFCALWYYIDPIDLKVMLAWLLRLPIIVGVVIMLSRIFFPQIKLSEYLDQAKAGNVASAIVVLGLMIFTAWLVMTAAGWSK